MPWKHPGYETLALGAAVTYEAVQGVHRHQISKILAVDAPATGKPARIADCPGVAVDLRELRGRCRKP